MRTVGLLGGMSWQSSIEYERAINQAVAERLGGTASADLLIRSFNFTQVEALQAAGDWRGCADLLIGAARALERAGAEAIAICTNTMHRVAHEVQDALDVPLLHIADATGQAAVAADLKRVALLGTRYTMELPFLRERLATAHGLEVLVPAEAARAEVHKIIYEELVVGRLENSSRETLLRIMGELLAEGAQGIIAGCTEIELLVTPKLAEVEFGVPYLATSALHARYIADFALGSD